MLCADAIIKKLTELGVDTVFGYPGANIAPLYHALSKSNIRHILTGNEQFAGMMASGYYMASGKVGVCFVTSGPGAVNMISGIANAYADSTPLIVFSGQVPKSKIGTDAFQEADITGAAAPFCKYTFLETSAKSVLRNIEEAFYIATSGRPAPVLIDIPINIQTEEVDEFETEMDLMGYTLPPKVTALTVAPLAAKINSAKKPLILVGGGVKISGAEKEVKALSEKGIPYCCTMRAKSAIDGAYDLGMAGIYGAESANNAIKEADLLIILGSRVSDRTIIDFKGEAIHIDIDMAELSKNIPAATLNADLKDALSAILPLIKNRKCWTSEKTEPTLTLFGEFAKKVSLDSFPITADVGNNLIETLNGAKNEVFASLGLGTMGFSLPSAVGVSLVCGTTFAFMGDGGFNMSLPVLSVIKEEKLPVKIVISDNKCLKMIEDLQDICYEENHYATALSGMPDYEAISKAYGFSFIKVSSVDDIDNAYNKALSDNGAVIIVVGGDL